MRMENISQRLDSNQDHCNQQWTDQQAWPCVYHYATLTSVGPRLELIFIHPTQFFFLPLIIYNLQRSHRFSPLISYHRIYPNLNSIGISEVRWWFAQASNLRFLLDRLFSYMSRPWGFTSFYIMRSRNVIRCKFSNWNIVLGNADGKY